MSFQNARIVKVAASPRDYHRQDSDRGSKDYVMSSSGLREFGRCPARWLAGYEPPDSDAKKWGSLLDTRSLTPEQFHDRYVIQPATYVNEKKETKPWNNNATVCREWRASQNGKEIISAKELAECDDAIKRLWQDSVIKAWFDACDRQVWVAAQWEDDRTGLSVPVRCLLDFVPRADTEFAKCLGDMKTTRSGSLIPWQRHCYEMGYYIQAAFNLDMYVAATQEDRHSWCFILQENYPPWQTARRIMHPEFVDFGRRKYRALLASYCWSLRNNNWPGYDDHDEATQGWSVVSQEPWMESRDVFAPRNDSEQYAKTLEEAGL